MREAVMKGLNIRHLFSALMNLAHLVRACNFKFPFLQSSFICFSKKESYYQLRCQENFH